MSQANVAAAVTAVVIAYQSSKDLLQSVRLLDNGWAKATEEVVREQGLMDALSMGENTISRRYHSIHHELGEAFRIGDRVSQEKLFQTAQLIDVRIASLLQQAIKIDTILIDYDKLTQDAILFRRAALGIMEQLRELYLPERLADRSEDRPTVHQRKTQPKSSLSGEDQNESYAHPSTYSQVPAPSTSLRPGSRPMSDPSEQSARFKRFLLNRKAKLEASLPAGPINLPVVEHFQWQGAALDNSQPGEDRGSNPTSKTWYTCANAPVMLNISKRPRKSSDPKLGAWEKWRQSDQFSRSHASPFDYQASSDYSSYLRCSSMHSAPKAIRPEPLRLWQAGSAYQAGLSSEEESSPQSRTSTSSDISTQSTSPASLASDYDRNHDRDSRSPSESYHIESQRPAIPQKSPLRTLRQRQDCTVASNFPPLHREASIEYPQKVSCTSTHPSMMFEFTTTSTPAPSFAMPVPPTSVNHQAQPSSVHGFCQGALAIRKSFDEEAKLQARSLRIDNRVSFFHCRSCSYGFDSLPTTSIAMDTRVYAAAGVLYRQAFLAKSHTECRPDSPIAFGCLFCLEERRSICVYDGVDLLMGHIMVEHASSMDREVQRRTKCIFGRVADGHEDFDICIPITSSKRAGMSLEQALSLTASVDSKSL